MAWIAGRFAMADKADGSVLEPTAGNGMLVFTIPVGQVHVNELDKTRLDNLREQGFAQVTQQDATEPFDGDVRYDVVIANPPFGKREAVEYDGKKIPGLDPQITLNALSSMKDDGRAAIIIGGNMEYANNGAIKSMKPFFTYLYDHYNVKGVIDMGGGLYAKQGTTFPTRMILIDGRRTNEERAQTAVYPPVENKAIRKAESFDDLYEIINEVLNFNEKTNGTEVLRSQGGRHLSVADNASGETDGAGHNRQSEADDESGSQTERRGRTGLEGNSESGQRPVLGKRGQNDTVGETGRGTDTIGKPSTDGRGLEQRTVGNEPQPVDGVDVQRIGLGLKGKPKKRDLTEEKLPYRPHNTAFRLESVAPAAMVEAMDKVLSQIEAQHGSIDEFVKTELGYDTIAETYQALAAEQMDSVAMAIYQMKQEQALIIGDQTGVGKGRQMAALIRWAVQRGEKPVFITQKADLFSDIYRDLVDVGSGDLVPFIFNSDGAMVDSKGNTVHKPLSSAEMAKFITENEDTKQLLSAMTRQNAFISRLADGGTYRFHHMMKECAEQAFAAMDKEKQTVYLERYGKWYEEHRQYLHALASYRKSGNFNGALRVIQKDAGILLASLKAEDVLNFLSKCPKEDLEAYPLSVLVLMRCMFNWRKIPEMLKLKEFEKI